MKLPRNRHTISGIQVALTSIVLLALPFLLASVANAQDTGTAQPAEDTVQVGEYLYDVDPDQPFIIVADRVQNSPEGPTIVPLVLMQLPDGSFTRMTPCDDVIVLCQPVYIVPEGTLEDATAGDSYILGEKVTVRTDG